MIPAREKPLVDAIQRGDQSALGELLNRYQHRLYNVALRMVGNCDDAADVTQEAMLKIVEHIDDFHGNSAIATWMIRIVMKLCISHLLERRSRQTLPLDTGSSTVDVQTAIRADVAQRREPDPGESVQESEMIELLYRALNHISAEFRSVIVLRDIDHMDYRQIALVLEKPVGTVKSRLFCARLSLRREMMRLTGRSRTVWGSLGG